MTVHLQREGAHLPHEHGRPRGERAAAAQGPASIEQHGARAFPHIVSPYEPRLHSLCATYTGCIEPGAAIAIGESHEGLFDALHENLDLPVFLASPFDDRSTERAAVSALRALGSSPIRQRLELDGDVAYAAGCARECRVRYEVDLARLANGRGWVDRALKLGYPTSVVAEATEQELNVALATPPSSDASNLDLIAAAKRIDETRALLKARSDRLAKREEELAALEGRVLARDEELNARATALEDLERGAKEAHARARQAEEEVRTREGQLQGREVAIRERELNAEASFAAERRASLKQLDDEAATLRTELSKARAQIAKERADWEAERRAEDEAWRDKQNQTERSSAEQIRVERELLSKERAELKVRAAQVELERDVLREDREAFDERVVRRAAHELEAAKAKQKDVEARLASAQASRDELYEKLRLRDEAERALGNRPLDEVKKELDSLIRERDSLNAQLAKRPNHDVAERLASLERAQEGWESDRARLTQESVAARTALAKASIAVTELETLRDQKAALESARDLLHTALEELRKDVNERIRRADGVSPFPACSQMDCDSGLQTQTPVTDEISDLKAFCQDLQHRIAIDPANPEKVLFYERYTRHTRKAYYFTHPQADGVVTLADGSTRKLQTIKANPGGYVTASGSVIPATITYNYRPAWGEPPWEDASSTTQPLRFAATLISVE